MAMAQFSAGFSPGHTGAHICLQTLHCHPLPPGLILQGSVPRDALPITLGQINHKL